MSKRSNLKLNEAQFTVLVQRLHQLGLGRADDAICDALHCAGVKLVVRDE